VPELLFAAKGWAKNLAPDQTGEQLSFLYSVDTTATKLYQLAYWKESELTRIVIDTTNKLLPEGWTVSEYETPAFTNDGLDVFLGIAPKPIRAGKDTLTDDEKVSVDIWNWKDNELQTQQIKQLDEEFLYQNQMNSCHWLQRK